MDLTQDCASTFARSFTSYAEALIFSPPSDTCDDAHNRVIRACEEMKAMPIDRLMAYSSDLDKVTTRLTPPQAGQLLRDLSRLAGDLGLDLRQAFLPVSTCNDRMRRVIHVQGPQNGLYLFQWMLSTMGMKSGVDQDISILSKERAGFWLDIDPFGQAVYDRAQQFQQQLSMAVSC